MFNYSSTPITYSSSSSPLGYTSVLYREQNAPQYSK